MSMEVAIGLPNTVPGTTRDQLLNFAREGEARGFSSLGSLDRLVYPNYEPLVALSAAAAVTERIRLVTGILLLPLRVNAALVAKQAASLQALSGGRFVLGVAPGLREDDYEASGVSMRERGAMMDSMLEKMKRVWAGDEFGTAGAIGPPIDEPPQLVLGGRVDASFERAARFGDGWFMGGGTPEQFGQGVTKLRDAWSAAGREGEPRAMALAYFALGPDAERLAEEDLGHYYAWLGEDVAGQIIASAATDPETVNQYVSAFEQAACDELVWFPTGSDPDQATQLADALGK
jgi:alkanesulfonate monooxygenase SsuD/methylene tetrahydromethanopterin reductase-like flavin-dependent oxidoreductase (luciferase family)